MISPLEADPRILIAAEKLIKTRGYHAILLADVATEAGVPLPAVQSHYPDKEALLEALLEKYSPKQDIQDALRQLRMDNPEELVRQAIHRLIEIFNAHQNFANLALIDVQVNGGKYLALLFKDLAAEAASFINRLSNLPGTRPISSIMLGRAFASLLLGFIATQQLAPEGAQFAMRVYPTKTWVDGITEIFLHGVLEAK